MSELSAESANATMGILFIIGTIGGSVLLIYLWMRFNPMQPGKIKNENIRIAILFFLGLLTFVGAFHSRNRRDEMRKQISESTNNYPALTNGR